MTSGTTVRSHIVFAVERLCEFCEHRANRFILCIKCRSIIGTCGNHNRPIQAEREAHKCPD